MNVWAYQQLVKHFGPLWLVKRALSSGSQRLGILKFKLPSKPWDQIDPKLNCQLDSESGSDFLSRKQQSGVQYLFDPDHLSGDFTRFDLESNLADWAQQIQQKICSGSFQYFSARWIEHGQQPNWFLNPYSNQRAPHDQHFSKINEFGSKSEGYGDVKAIWELSRFSFAYDLVRCYSRTRDPQCAEEFWRLVEHWMENNPPYQGINWKCGQEASFRLFAILFGVWAFASEPCSHQERISKLYKFVYVTALRVQNHIGYAINQQNNHGISEALLLWSVGCLFPEFKESENWKRVGERVLVRLCNELIYDDGGFSQGSANYHRLVVQLLCLMIRLAQRNNLEIDDRITAALNRLTDCIASMVEKKNGLVPRFGNDDGAYLLPLTHCDYSDYRPAVHVAKTILGQDEEYGRGDWDEALLWFGFPIPTGAPAKFQPEPRLNLRKQAGCHTLSLGGDKIFLRAGSYRHRPAQLDATHVDLWWQGFDVATDPGIYSYNAEGCWSSLPFYQSAFHNTVLVDEKEPSKRVSKFMFLPWQTSELGDTHEHENMVAAECHRRIDFQISPPVSHRRIVVLLKESVFLIMDSLQSEGSHDYRLDWLLNCTEITMQDRQMELALKSGDEFYLALHTNTEQNKLEAIYPADDSPVGWIAPRYLELEPAVSVRSISRNVSDCSFVSVFAKDKNAVSFWSEHANEIMQQDSFSRVISLIQRVAA